MPAVRQQKTLQILTHNSASNKRYFATRIHQESIDGYAGIRLHVESCSLSQKQCGSRVGPGANLVFDEQWRCVVKLATLRSGLRKDLTLDLFNRASLVSLLSVCFARPAPLHEVGLGTAIAL